jgi:hypothetical protein
MELCQVEPVFFFCGKILQKILAIGSCFPEKWKHHGE